MKHWYPILLTLAVQSTFAGAEHPACNDVDHPFRHLSPVELRDIADQCQNPAMSALMANRAQHAELVQDHAYFERITRIQRSRAEWHMDINVIFLGLVEVFSDEMGLSEEQRISVLDATYSRANEIAELRLRGYDPQAERLESWSPPTLLMINSR